MEKHYRPLLDSDDQFDPTRFSAFVEMQAPRVQEALVTSGYTKTEFAGWVNDQILYPLDRVRRLPAILANPQARSVFLTDGAREAEKVLDSPSTVEALEDATLVQLANALVERIDKMSYTDLRRLREDLDTPENHALTEARDQLAELCKLIASPSSHQCLNQRNTQTWFPYSTPISRVDSVRVRGNVSLPTPASSESRTRPPSIEGYVPDAYVMLNEQGRVVIGEAKSMRDLENSHTEAQVTAFLRRCGMAEGSALILAVPWPIERLARALLTNFRARGELLHVEAVVLSEANRMGTVTTPGRLTRCRS